MLFPLLILRESSHCSSVSECIRLPFQLNLDTGLLRTDIHQGSSSTDSQPRLRLRRTECPIQPGHPAASWPGQTSH